MPGIVKTFVSHSSDDIEDLRKFLLEKGMMLGINPWLDRQDALHLAGYSLDETLQEAIKEDNVGSVTLFLTENALASDWVKQEIDWAKKHGKHVIPIVATDNKAVVEQFKELVLPHNPLYLEHEKAATVFSWARTVLHRANVNESEEVVLHLGHRENNVRPDIPDEWQKKWPVLVLRTADHGRKEVHDWDFNTWQPENEAEYKDYEKHIRILHQALAGVKKIRVSGFTCQGLAGIIGKYWARSSSTKRITTWNTRKNEEWIVEDAHPGTGGPEGWQILQAEEIRAIGGGKNVMLGHFAVKEQFDQALNWIKEGAEDLEIGSACNLAFPFDKITADNAAVLAGEIARSFSWIKEETKADAIYWFCGLPIAMIPLVTHLAGAKGRIIFMDYSRRSGSYMRAFTLE